MIIQILIQINFNMARVTTLIISLMMVFILVMQGNFSWPISEGATSTITDFECHTDNDCLGENIYCDISLNLCSQCLNCSVYFRTQKKNLMCPKNILDCSNCLNGYSEEIFFGGEIRDICVPVDSNNILPTPAKIGSDSRWQDIGIFFVIINICLLSVLWAYFYKNIWKNSHNVSNALQDRLENVLPSYNSCMKLDNFVTDDVQEFHLFTGEQPPRNEWRHQSAVPFNHEKDIEGPSNNYEEEEDNEEQNDENEAIEEADETGNRECESPELHDEETMPSDWIPTPLYLSQDNYSRRHLPNNYLRHAPPSKRIRLEEPTDEKSNENKSDMSQDESDMSQDES